jgi:hypothetical protein
VLTRVAFFSLRRGVQPLVTSTEKEPVDDEERPGKSRLRDGPASRVYLPSKVPRQ